MYNTILTKLEGAYYLGADHGHLVRVNEIDSTLKYLNEEKLRIEDLFTRATDLNLTYEEVKKRFAKLHENLAKACFESNAKGPLRYQLLTSRIGYLFTSKKAKLPEEEKIKLMRQEVFLVFQEQINDLADYLLKQKKISSPRTR